VQLENFNYYPQNLQLASRLWPRTVDPVVRKWDVPTVYVFVTIICSARSRYTMGCFLERIVNNEFSFRPIPSRKSSNSLENFLTSQKYPESLESQENVFLLVFLKHFKILKIVTDVCVKRMNYEIITYEKNIFSRRLGDIYEFYNSSRFLYIYIYLRRFAFIT